MTRWTKRTLKLKANHKWKAKPGYRIFVADHGAVRFNFPEDWIVAPDSDSIKLHDAKSPDDNCTLAVSLIHLPPIDWSGLPLADLIENIIEGDTRGVTTKGRIVNVRRFNMEAAWTEVSFVDPVEQRAAFSRICLGRGSNIQSLITFDFWADDAPRLTPVWDEVIRSLEVGRYIEDPTRG